MLTLCAVAAILAAAAWPAWSALLVAGFAAAALVVAVGAFVVDRLIAAEGQYLARYLAELLSFPLGILALASWQRPELVRRWATPPTRAIVLILGVAGAAWNIAAARDWAHYTRSFRAELARHQGLVPWETAIGELGPTDAARFTRLNFAWTTPELSIVLAPGGDVHTILDDPPRTGWRPFDPAVAAALPAGTGFSTQRYQAAPQAPTVSR
jgi:hypothetical protein